jgi:hypothetical protein
MGMYNNPRAKAHKELGVDVVPDLGPIADAAAAPVKVGKGNLCRVKGVADAFISFGDDETALAAKTLDAAAKETFQMEAGYFYIAATGDYVKTSVAMRIEVIKD